ncbi:MAG: F0F1 ATP synthase subunit delta [Pseudomonadota bacterium]|jgi:F-type H+-transporting ATPase subunit delta
MAETATIARPYARAAFRHAVDQSALASWSAVLAVGAEVAADHSAAALFGNPRVTHAELIEFVVGVATAAGAAVNAEARNFLALLAENNRLALLPEIAIQFEALKAEVEHTIDVEVTTAMALSDAQRAKLSGALAQRFSRTVRLHETIDAELVGGAIVRAGDLVLDGSLTGRLARLEQQLSQP